MPSPSRLLPPGSLLRGSVEQVVWAVLRLSTPSERHARALAGLFGIGERSGYPPASPAAATAAMGVSGTTMRRWLREAEEAAGSVPVPVSIACAMAVAADSLPRLVPDLAAAWRAAGCTRQALHPAAVADAARLFGLAPGWEVDTAGWAVPIALPTGRAGEYRMAARRLRRHLLRREPTSWREAAKLAGLPTAASVRVVVEAAGLHAGVAGPVDLTPSGVDVPLLRQMQVAGRPMPIKELLVGLQRWSHEPRRRAAPTAPELGRWLSFCPLYERDDPGWRPAGLRVVPLAPRDRVMLAAVEAAGGKARVGEVLDALLAAGSPSRGSGHQAVRACPVLRGIPGTRGWLTSLSAGG